MYGVVNEGGGTGYDWSKLQNIDFCGKSGTAQMMSYNAANRLGNKKRDGWFVGFAPRRNPEIVVAAIVQDTVEHGGEAARPGSSRYRQSVLRQEEWQHTANHDRSQFRHRRLLFGRRHGSERHGHNGSRLMKALPMKDRPRVQDFDWALLAIVGCHQCHRRP